MNFRGDETSRHYAGYTTKRLERFMRAIKANHGFEVENVFTLYGPPLDSGSNQLNLSSQKWSKSLCFIGKT